MGDKILEANGIGIALTQSQVSHYDPKTNRCYVELTVQSADMTKPMEVLDATLYDGQTRELLASASVEHGKKSGIIFGKSLSSLSADAGFYEASEFINKMMDDDRKQ